MHKLTPDTPQLRTIDAVSIATPDHIHAVATAMKLGKHVHCQKPLTRSVYKARMIGKLARETRVATQMGKYCVVRNHPMMVGILTIGATLCGLQRRWLLSGSRR